MPVFVEVWFTDADGRELDRVTIVANGMGEMHIVALQMEERFNAARGTAAYVSFREVGPDAKIEGMSPFFLAGVRNDWASHRTR